MEISWNALIKVRNFLGESRLLQAANEFGFINGLRAFAPAKQATMPLLYGGNCQLDYSTIP